MHVEPAEGTVALKFINDELATCEGAGRDVTICKRGDTVVVDKWARQGINIGDDIIIAAAYCVKRVVI